MIGLALALAADARMAVTAAGMEPQLRLIRLEAAKEGWPITCVGHSGEEGVLRIGVPPGTPRKNVDAFVASLMTVASSVSDRSTDATKQTCDQEPLVQDRLPSTRALFLVTRDPDKMLQEVARECGYSHAFWRHTRAEDLARFKWRIGTSKYSFALDAGEDAAARNGPLTCFQQMSARVLSGSKR